MKQIEEVRQIFEKDRFATENGAVIDEIGELYAKCSLTIEPKHRNAMGAVMGGVPFMLADFAFAVATNHEKMGTVSVSSNIVFAGVAKGSRLIAETRCVKNGRSVCYFNVDVKDDLGNLVAQVTVTGYRKV